MKKILIISLLIVLLLGLVACNKNNEENKSMFEVMKEAINSEEQEPYDILNLKTTLENRLSEIRPLICK